MDNNKLTWPPTPCYEIVRMPDGTHSGVRIDYTRLVVEIQRRGVKQYVDLALNHAQTIEKPQEVCYDGGQSTG